MNEYSQVASILLTAEVSADVDYNKAAINKSIIVGRHKGDPFGAVEDAKAQWIKLASAEDGEVDWLLGTEFYPDSVPGLPHENLRFKVAIELDYLSVGFCPDVNIEDIIQGTFPLLKLTNVNVSEGEVTVAII